MSQAEALLATLAEHTHSVVDDDARFVINVETRTITSDIRRHYLMQRDHNSTRFTFELPRYVEGHDMSLCNQAKIHYNNIDEDGNENADVCDADGLHLDGDKVICSWLISRNATQLAGSLNFLIQYQCVVDGTPVYEWHTDIYSEIVVKPGRSNSEQAVVEHADILEQWRDRIFGAGDSVMVDIAAAGEVQKDAIAAKAEAVLATIPEDYTVTHLMADAALRTKASAIVVEAEGETIVVDNSSDDYLQGLKMYGKTTQDGTPTLEAPVELVSIEKPKILLCGKNLVFGDATRAATMNNGIVINVTEGSSEFILNGEQNATSNASAFLVRSMMLYPGTYTVSVYGLVGSDYINVKQLSGEQHYLFTAATRDHPKTFTVDERVEIGVEIVVRANSYYSNTTVKIQLEAGDSVTDYESYIEPYTMTSNLVLRGIPVTSGGNYTDENGQQWIADYVDFERGMYVQNVDSYILDGRSKLVVKNDEKSESYLYYHKQDNEIKRVGGYCTHFVHVDAYPEKVAGTFNLTKSHVVLMTAIGIVSGDNATTTDAAEFNDWLHAQHEAGTPVAIAYVLAAPIETPLTEEELFAFSQLHSNYPTTTVLNDSGAHMAVSYNADTKLYVDGKIREAIDNYLSSHLL